jgi:hypothetical protein
MKRAKKSRLPRQTAHESGQAAVEFALVILFVIFLFLGMLEMIFLMYSYNALAGSAKEGVRYAIVHGTGVGANNCSGPGTTGPPGVTCADAGGMNVIKNSRAGLSMQGNRGMQVHYPEGCSSPGCLVTVIVTNPYHPFFGLGWPSLTINAAANGRIMN